MPVKTSKTDTISPDDKPVRATLRTYQVGFGDCFLLIFEYTSGKKVYTLIDFGSTQLPDFSPPDQMTRVAEDIQKECGGKLDIVIATHRHKDHISGFSTDGAGTGKIIRDCNPKVVLQPWTEDPNLDDDKVKLSTAAGAPAETGKALNAGQVQSLLNMNKVADSAFKEAEHLSDDRFAVPLPNTVANQLNFLAVDNGIPNRSAVANLAAMGKESHYISYGTDLSFLNQILPNVKITVMGPPTLEQDDKIKKEKSSDKNEFWMLYATTSKSAGEFIDEEEDLFPGADVF